MTVTARPWDELLDTLTWPRIEKLYDYWRRHPPMHVLAAAYIGYKPPQSAAEKQRENEAAGFLPLGKLKEMMKTGKFGTVH